MARLRVKALDSTFWLVLFIIVCAVVGLVVTGCAPTSSHAGIPVPNDRVYSGPSPSAQPAG